MCTNSCNLPDEYVMRQILEYIYIYYANSLYIGRHHEILMNNAHADITIIYYDSYVFCIINTYTYNQN